MDQPARGIAAQERSQNAGGNANCVNDRTKRRAGDIGVGLVKVGVIEDVKELQSNSEIAGFVDWKVEVFHHRQIGVKVVRTPYLICSLISPGVDGGSGRRIQTGKLRPCVHARCGSSTDRQNCGSRANYRTGTQIVCKEWVAIGYRVIEGAESTGGVIVVRRDWKSRSPEKRSRQCPTGQQSLQAAEFWCCPHIIEAGIVTDIVISISIVEAFEVEWILWIRTAFVSSEIEG